MTDILDRLKSALSDRYSIERELGSGGMATVYLAEDLKHHRPVAIKVLRPELAAALGAERFLREIEIAARLTHPHILPLHDSGEADGFLYYVMPYVEGESLRDRLEREKQLPLEDALQIARNVAAALGYAHSHDVVHRDIKPENILLSAGEAVVADFGIARAITAAGGENLTDTGVSIGTPVYMSPEQAAGGKDLDGRSDTYSLGCVLYEMLAGEPPFTAPTVESIVHQHLTAEPPVVTTRRPAVPAEVAEALRKALSKTPADRFSTAIQFAEALAVAEAAPRTTAAPVAVTAKPKRNVMAYAAVAVLAIIGGYTIISRTVGRTESATAAETPKLAVLPFNNLGSPEDEYFADGITEEITSRIAEISGLRVISRQSAVQYRNSDKTLQQIGKELSVDYVLEGTIRTDRSPDGSGQVRVTPQLIRVSDDAHLWTDRYTADLVPGEIFGVQADIAEQVAGALNVTLLEPERSSLQAKPTDNLEAYDYYLRGNDYFSRRVFLEEDARTSVEMYEKAVALDPNFATAYAALSRARMWLLWGYGRSGELPPSKAAVDKALQLAPDLPEAHIALGDYYYYGSRDYGKALEQYTIVQREQPSNAVAIAWIGWIRRRQGRWEEAVAQVERALELDPRNPAWANDLAATYRNMRRYAEAERYHDRSISLAPDIPGHYTGKVLLYLRWDGSTERAQRVLQDAAGRIDLGRVLLSQELTRIFADRYGEALDRITLETAGTDTVNYYFTKAELAARRNQSELAHSYYDSVRVVLEGRVQDWPGQFLPHAALGRAYAGLGRKADAIRVGEKAVDLIPVSRDALAGSVHVRALAEIYVMVGEYDAALDRLEFLLSIPSDITTGLLRVDPIWDPLREYPRFKRMLEEGEQ